MCVVAIGVVVDGVVAGGVFQITVHGDELDTIVLDAYEQVVEELEGHDGLDADHLVEIHSQ